MKHGAHNRQESNKGLNLDFALEEELLRILRKLRENFLLNVVEQKFHKEQKEENISLTELFPHERFLLLIKKFRIFKTLLLIRSVIPCLKRRRNMLRRQRENAKFVV